MSRINRVPVGLQDVLGSTAMGDNPSDLLEEVRATFDMWPFWMADRVRHIAASASVAVRGATVIITVPQNEIWQPIILSIALSGGVDVGTTFRMTPCMFTVPGNPAVRIRIAAGPLQAVATVGEIITEAVHFPQRFFINSGQGIGLTMDEYTPVVGPDTFTANLLYVQMNK